MKGIKLIVWKWIVVFYSLSALSAISAVRRRSRNHATELQDTDYMNNERRSRNYRSNHLAGDTDEDLDALDPEEIANMSTNNEDIETVRRKPIDPKGSWLEFVRYSEDRTTEKKPKRRKKKRKKNRSKMLHGPPGPVGPQGPRGIPGPAVSKEEILADLQDLIKEATEKRVKEIMAEMVLSFNNNSTFIPRQLDSTQQVQAVPRIYAGFLMKLRSKTMVQRKTYTELKSFQQPFGGGAFQRGDAFNAKEGRFTSPRGGVYQFTANLHLRVRAKRKPKGRTKSDESLKIVICIDSLCQTNTSIETIMGVEVNSKIFSASVTGILQLKEKQYVSVYVDNSSSQNVVVLQGSDYSGVILGV